jgi:photosystem II stability/assembly factor-like uncharacterized protein
MVKKLKTVYFMILFVFLTANLCIGQWVWQNPSPFGNAIYGSFFVDANTGTAVGAIGSIMRTTNGGINWVEQTSGTRNNLNSVYFSDANTGTAVGVYSKVLRTTNGGLNWNSQHIDGDTSTSLSNAYFLNANTGFIMGACNRIYKTTDGGNNWVLKTSLLANDYIVMDIRFLNANTGVAVGQGIGGTNTIIRKILRTTDGGQSWDSVNSAYAPRALYSVGFVNANTGVAVGNYGYIIRTTDGGLNWTSVSSGITSAVYAVKFLDSLNVIAVGASGKILHSIDGGLTYTLQSLGTSYPFYSLNFSDANTGTITGSFAVYRTTNGGANWTSYSSTKITNMLLEKVRYINANTGVIVGDGGAILRTANCGTNWVVQTSPTYDYNYSDVCFINENTGFAVGSDEYKKKTKSKDGGIFVKTTNGGANWTLSYPGFWVYGVSFVDVNTGWVAGVSYSNVGGVYHTTNGGANWTQQLDSAVSYVKFFDLNTGFACGWSGIFHTTNGGVNWEQQSNYTAYWMSFINANTGWIAISGTVYHTTDGGKNWVTQSTGVYGVSSWDISFTDENNGVVVYDGPGAYSRTSDGGNTWWIEYTRTNYPLYGACFNINGLTIIGEFGTIQHNSYITVPSAPVLISPLNGAISQSNTPKMKWSNISNASSYRIQVSSDSNFATTTWDTTGLIIDSVTVPSGKLTNGIKYYWRVNATNTAGTSSWSTIFNFTVSATGTSSTASELPKEYKLYNNYPNPFNPTTKIRFDIPKNGLTKIAIYDVLGREMKTLVNENLTAGSYEVEWNGTSYASGIYFYRMTSSSYTSVKRMLMIK